MKGLARKEAVFLDKLYHSFPKNLFSVINCTRALQHVLYPAAKILR